MQQPSFELKKIDRELRLSGFSHGLAVEFLNTEVGLLYKARKPWPGQG